MMRKSMAAVASRRVSALAAAATRVPSSRSLVRQRAFVVAPRGLIGRPALAANLSGDSQGSALDDFFESSTNNQYFLPFKYRRKEAREKYKLGHEIGRGMFATVYQAQDSTGNKVAIKVMDKRTTPRELCERELRILEQLTGKVHHNRITPIIDVYEDSTKLYFVLELMQGDLFDYVAKNGRMGEEEAAVVVRKLCYALEALHRSGILHRDIKLENLLIESRKEDEEDPEEKECASHFKLGDFGFARNVDEKDGFRNPAGTLGYAAPEVLSKREYGPACDVWSAGIVLYIMLAGHPPFPTRSGVEVAKLSIEEQLEVELEAIHFGRESKRWNKHLQKGAWKDVSPGAKKLLSKMLRVDPAKRFTTQQVLTDPWILANAKLRQYEYLNFE